MVDASWQRAETRAIAELIKDIDICMFVTRADGAVRGRPMSNNGKVEYDGDSWFFSLRDTPKVEEIEADPRVELAYVATERAPGSRSKAPPRSSRTTARKQELWDDELEPVVRGAGPRTTTSSSSRSAPTASTPGPNGEETIIERGGRVERVPSAPGES